MAGLARWSRRLLPWAAPPLTVVAVLAIGHGMDRQERPLAFDMPEPLPPGQPPPAAGELAVELQAPDGTPAAGALLLLLEPEPALGVAGADGVARVPLYGPGPYRAWAYADGYSVLRPEPFAEPPRRPWRFAPLPEAPVTLDPPLTVTDRRVRVVDASTRAPLAGALVFAGEHNPNEDDFALAFTDADGAATLHSAPPGPLSVHVYAPLLPNEEAWKLVSQALGDGDGVDAAVELQVAPLQLVLRRLPPGELLRVERVDVPGLLPLALVPADGSWRSGALPPGRYRCTVLEEAREFPLTSGAIEIDWGGS